MKFLQKFNPDAKARTEIGFPKIRFKQKARSILSNFPAIIKAETFLNHIDKMTSPTSLYLILMQYR